MDSSSEYRVVISERAQKDFDEIMTKIAELTLFKRSVEKWAILLLERILSLKNAPKRFGRYELDGRFRSTHVGKYRIIYYIDEEKKMVAVMRIVYARRDLGKVEVA